MNCHIQTQTAIHASADNQACAEAEMNELAVDDLLNDSRGKFSNGYIDLIDVIEAAVKQNLEFITDILCEMAIAKGRDIKKHRALLFTYKTHLGAVALEMNEGMGV